MKLSFNKLSRILGGVLGGYVLFRSIQELYWSAPVSGQWLGKFSTKWGAAFIGLSFILFLLLIATLVAIGFPQKAREAVKRLISFREKLAGYRWPIAIVILLIPVYILLYTRLGNLFTGPYLRLVYLFVISLLFAICVTTSQKDLVQPTMVIFSLVLVGSVHLIAGLLTNVTNYPFSLSWSEGNRLYDYSMHVNSNRYTTVGELEIPYKAFGRYYLWGSLFLIPNTPIWMHRLWNAILWSMPYLALGYLLARWGKLKTIETWTFAMWILLFLTQGPIYPPLVLSALVVVAFVRLSNWVLSLIGAAVAGFYASASRWTWLPAPTTWSVIILLADLKFEKNEPWFKLIRRLVPVAITAVIGLGTAMLANPKLFSPRYLSKSTAFSQPLLWYRLFPNSTYPEGILLGLIIATAPLITLLIWLVLSKRWNLNWLQILAYAASSAALLSIGLVASVKIGGGNNLHNLDMFLVTLAILVGLMLRQNKIITLNNWPSWVQGLFVLAIFLPAWGVVKGGAPLDLPGQDKVNKGLKVLATEVAKAQVNGEVLFIDQRQLLTFGYLQNIPLVSQYEKKYMMDQAMAGDKDYFQKFYQDLANHRFTLIVTEPLYKNIQDPNYSFQEENNAWVQWITKPLLCYYEPTMTLRDVRVQLLVPRTNPINCPIEPK